MSVNSINAVSGATSTSSSSSSDALTKETKAKLEALGIDTTDIKTETDGQKKLQEAQSAQANQAQKTGGDPQIQSIKDEATSLAQAVGVSVSKYDKISDILSNVSDKIADLQAQAGQDPEKLKEVQGYQEQFDTISSSFATFEAQKQESQGQLTGSMDALASYNKVYHKIAA